MRCLTPKDRSRPITTCSLIPSGRVAERWLSWSAFRPMRLERQHQRLEISTPAQTGQAMAHPNPEPINQPFSSEPLPAKALAP